MKLIRDDVLAAMDSSFDSIPGLSDKYNLAFVNDARTGRSLKNYIILTERAELFAARGITAEEVFWSRYFWFLRFVNLRQAMHGSDAGLEQQAFQILEYPYPDCAPDWSSLESVTMAVDTEVRAELQQPAGDAV